MSETIQELIDMALVERPHQKSGKFSPSMFGRCFRVQYWNRKNEPQSNPSDKRDIRVLAVGKLFHDFAQEAIVGYYGRILWQKEVLVESDDVKGFADLVSDNEVDDIKSQHSRSFWWMSKKNCDIKKEKYPNWLQVMYYVRELGKQLGRLVFVSKDDLCIQEYVQPLDDYWREQLEKELYALRHLWAKNELPPAIPRCYIGKDGKSKECEWCSWLDKCNKLEGKDENAHNHKIQ